MAIQEVYAWETLTEDDGAPESCITRKYTVEKALLFYNVSTDVDEKLLEYIANSDDERTIILYCLEKPRPPLNIFRKSGVVLSKEYKQFKKDGGTLSPLEWNKIFRS